MVDSDPFGPAIEAAQAKIEKLLEERASLDKRRTEIDASIIGFKRAIDSLLAIYESETEEDQSEVETSVLGAPNGRQKLKFTDAIRLVLRQNSSEEIPISVPEIRAQLLNLGFSLDKYRQPLVPVHNTLRRLVEQHEVEHVKNADGQIVGYKWISPIERALVEDANFYDVVGGMRPLTVSPPGPANSMAGVFKPSAIRSRAETARLEAALNALKHFKHAPEPKKK